MRRTDFRERSARALCLAALLFLQLASCGLFDDHDTGPDVEWSYRSEGENWANDDDDSRLLTARWSVVMDREGNSYVAADGKLAKLSPSGEVMRTTALEGPEYVALQAVGPDGSVCGVWKGVLYVYGPNGSLLGTIDSVSHACFATDGCIYYTQGLRSPNQLAACSPGMARLWTLHLSTYLSSELGRRGKLGECSPPVVGPDGAIHVVAGTVLFVINRDGTLRWCAEAPYMQHRSGDYGVPAVDEDGSVYVPGSAIYVYAADGTLKWRKDDPCHRLRQDSSYNTYYVRGSSEIVALRPDGTVKSRVTPAFERCDRITEIMPSDWGYIYCETDFVYRFLGYDWHEYRWRALSQDGGVAWEIETGMFPAGQLLCGPDGLVCLLAVQGSYFGWHDD